MKLFYRVIIMCAHIHVVVAMKMELVVFHLMVDAKRYSSEVKKGENYWRLEKKRHMNIDP